MYHLYLAKDGFVEEEMPLYHSDLQLAAYHHFKPKETQNWQFQDSSNLSSQSVKLMLTLFCWQSLQLLFICAVISSSFLSCLLKRSIEDWMEVSRAAFNMCFQLTCLFFFYRLLVFCFFLNKYLSWNYFMSFFCLYLAVKSADRYETRVEKQGWHATNFHGWNWTAAVAEMYFCWVL